MTSVGIVVPAYKPNTRKLVAYLRLIQKTISPDRLHVELDDGSEETVRSIRETGSTVEAVNGRRGKGTAITTGFDNLNTDILAFVDADGATQIESLQQIISTISDDGYDLAIGSRRHPDANILSHQTVVRRFLGDGFVYLTNRLLNLNLYDYQCGAKAISSEGWSKVRKELYRPGFG